MLTNTDVTVWNKYMNTVTKMDEYKRTELKGVMLIASKGANIIKSGLVTADSVRITIPKGVNSGTKTFKAPKAWQATPNVDMGNFWTLQPGDKIAKGLVNYEITSPNTIAGLEKTYDNVYTITTVDTLDFGSNPHWAVGGL